MEVCALVVTALLGVVTGVASKVFKVHNLHWADQLQALFPSFSPFSSPQSSLGPAHCILLRDPSRPWTKPISFLEALEYPNAASAPAHFSGSRWETRMGSCTWLGLSWEAGGCLVNALTLGTTQR